MSWRKLSPVLVGGRDTFVSYPRNLICNGRVLHCFRYFTCQIVLCLGKTVRKTHSFKIHLDLTFVVIICLSQALILLAISAWGSENAETSVVVKPIVRHIDASVPAKYEVILQGHNYGTFVFGEYSTFKIITFAITFKEVQYYIYGMQ